MKETITLDLEEYTKLIYTVSGGRMSKPCYEVDTIIKAFNDTHIHRNTLNAGIEDVLCCLEDNTTTEQKLEYILLYLKEHSGIFFDEDLQKHLDSEVK